MNTKTYVPVIYEFNTDLNTNHFRSIIQVFVSNYAGEVAGRLVKLILSPLLLPTYEIYEVHFSYAIQKRCGLIFQISSFFKRIYSVNITSNYCNVMLLRLIIYKQVICLIHKWLHAYTIQIDFCTDNFKQNMMSVCFQDLYLLSLLVYFGFCRYMNFFRMFMNIVVTK